MAARAQVQPGPRGPDAIKQLLATTTREQREQEQAKQLDSLKYCRGILGAGF